MAFESHASSDEHFVDKSLILCHSVTCIYNLNGSNDICIVYVHINRWAILPPVTASAHCFSNKLTVYVELEILIVCYVLDQLIELWFSYSIRTLILIEIIQIIWLRLLFCFYFSFLSCFNLGLVLWTPILFSRKFFINYFLLFFILVWNSRQMYNNICFCFFCYRIIENGYEKNNKPANWMPLKKVFFLSLLNDSDTR